MPNFLYLILLLLFTGSKLLGNEPDSFFANSIIEDGFLCQNYLESEKYCDCLIDELSSIKITRSESQKGKIVAKNGNVIFYKFYPVTIELGDYSWTLLRYEDTNSRGWYRLRGYKENDFYHLYHKVLHSYLRKGKQVQELISHWVEVSPMMSNVELSCLFESAKRKRLSLHCLTANVFQLKAKGVYSSGGGNSLSRVLKNQGYSNLSPYVSRRLYRGTYPTPNN